MVREEVKLGRMHIRCGEPLPFDKATDVREFSGAVMRELQAGTVASMFHLECFVRRNPGSGISVSWLREAIEEREGVVLDSDTCSASTSSGVAEKGHHDAQTPDLDLELDLKPELDLDPAIERTFQHHWQHLFASALTHCPSNPALEHYIKENDYLGADKGVGPSPQTRSSQRCYPASSPPSAPPTPASPARLPSTWPPARPCRCSIS